MKKSGKKIFSTILILALVLGTISWAYGDELSDIRNQQSQVKSDLSELQDSIISQKEEVAAIQKEVDKQQAKIDEAEAKIAETEAEIQQMQDDIDNQKDNLGKRLRNMYKNGSVGFVDVILGSGSFSELISNVSMLQKIYASDQETLDYLEEQHKKMEEKKAVLAQENQKLKEEKKILDEKKQEAQKKTDAMQDEINQLQSKLEQLNADAAKLTGVILGSQDHNKEYEGVTGGGGSGAMGWPTDSRYITSPFGWRIHPVTGIGTGHTGLDIGAGYGTNVYAAESGTVIMSQVYGGYGNAVVIDHGGGISTLYGHNSSLLVSEGQHVSRGQVIALCGSTGISTGPHVHFEVRIYGNPVDPMGYL